MTPLEHCKNVTADRFQWTRIYLILKRASASRSSGEWNDDDFDVLADGAVVGRNLKVHAAPVGSPWIWTLAYGHNEDRTQTHGYAETSRGRDGGVRKELAANLNARLVSLQVSDFTRMRVELTVRVSGLLIKGHYPASRALLPCRLISSTFGQALAVRIVANLAPCRNDYGKALVSVDTTPVGLLCAAAGRRWGGGDLFIDENAVIVRDARDEDRSFVVATVRPPAVRLQCVTTGADRDNATAILERTWLVHRKELQVTFHVPNPLNQDRRVVESRPVGAVAVCIEPVCGNPDVLAAPCKTARGDGLGRPVRDCPRGWQGAPVDVHKLLRSIGRYIRADPSGLSSEPDAEFRPGQSVPN